MARSRVDRALFARLCAQGVPRKEIAHRCGCVPDYVRVFAQRHGIALPPLPEPVAEPEPPRKRPVAVPPAEPVAPPAEILATGGRYAALADFAARHGLSLRAAQLAWHRARAEVRE